MYIKAGAMEAARNECFLLKAYEILRTMGDTAGERAARAAFDRAIARHDRANGTSEMSFARVGNSTTENLR